MRTLILVAVLCLIAVPARAEVILFNDGLIQNYFKYDDPIFISFSDRVEDGCLPQPEAIKTTMELGLRRTGLIATDTPGIARWTLQIVTAGGELKSQDNLDICQVVVDAKLILGWSFRDYNNPDEWISLSVPALVQGFVKDASKPSMQSQINESVDLIVNDFTNEILKTVEK
jgi:hypothetical protein